MSRAVRGIVTRAVILVIVVWGLVTIDACTTLEVSLVGPLGDASVPCASRCEALSDGRPLLSCRERRQPSPLIVCSYAVSERPEVVDAWMAAPASGQAAATCRAACAQAGFEKIEACWMGSSGEAVACRYRVGFH